MFVVKHFILPLDHDANVATTLPSPMAKRLDDSAFGCIANATDLFTCMIYIKRIRNGILHLPHSSLRKIRV